MSLRSRPEALHNFGSASASGVQALISAVTRQTVRVYRLILVNGSTAGTIQLQDTSGNALSQAFSLISGGSVVLDTPINFDPWWSSDAVLGPGQGIQWNAVTTTAYAWDLWYLQGA